MAEFTFRNMSVKVLAANDGDRFCACCSYEWHCGGCSDCTDGATVPECGPCTETVTVDPCGPCTFLRTNEPECIGQTCLEGTGCINTVHIVIKADDPGFRPRLARSVSEIQREMAFLKVELRAAMGFGPEEEDAGQIQSLEDVANVRQALLDAVDELEERGRALDSEA